MNTQEPRTGYLGVDGQITFDCSCEEYRGSGQCFHTTDLLSKPQQ